MYGGGLLLHRAAGRVNPTLVIGLTSVHVERLGPNLKPGTVCVCGMSGLRKGMHTTQHPPSPAFRAEPDRPTNAEAVSRAVNDVNNHRPRFQVRARPS